MEGKTYFRQETKPLTNADLPTITICFGQDESLYITTPDCPAEKIEYSKDFVIFAFQDELQLGMNDKHELFIGEIKPWQAYKHCYKISPTMQTKDLPVSKIRTSLFILKFKNKCIDTDSAVAYFTTEENAYGAGNGKGMWYDGRVSPFNLKIGA